MKNILIIVPSLKFGGGAERVAACVGSELYDLGYNTKYFTFYNAETKYNFSGKEYCLNEKLNGNIIFKLFKLFIRAYKIKKICKNQGISTIFSNMEDANFSSIISKLFGNKSKVCVVIHHSISDYGKGLYYWLIKILYKYADKIVVLTQFEKDYLVKISSVKEEKIIIIPNAIDIDKIKKLKNQDLGEYKNLFNNKNFTFITVGRLNKIKNQRMIINCFKKLNEKYSNIQLLILGDGELKNDLKRISNNNIHFLGNQENVFKFLNRSDCFLLSSLSESFSNVIIEAMACGVPVISTDTQGPCEILENGKYGVITENNDGEEFYEAMENFITNDEIKNKYIKLSNSKINDYLSVNISKKREDII